jgi:hypothetical protein
MSQEKEQPKLGAIGVFIYDIYGELTAPENWNNKNNDKAVGVYVGSEEHRFVIAKENAGSLAWGGTGIDLSDITIGLSDTDGATYTERAINRLTGVIDTNGIAGTPGCEACANYVFPTGQKGYMGSSAEWAMCLNNKALVVEAMSKCGGTSFSSAYWTSTPATKIGIFCHWSSDVMRNSARFYTYNVRAFLKV